MPKESAESNAVRPDCQRGRVVFDGLRPKRSNAVRTVMLPARRFSCVEGTRSLCPGAFRKALRSAQPWNSRLHYLPHAARASPVPCASDARRGAGRLLLRPRARRLARTRPLARFLFLAPLLRPAVGSQSAPVRNGARLWQGTCGAPLAAVDRGMQSGHDGSRVPALLVAVRHIPNGALTASRARCCRTPPRRIWCGRAGERPRFRPWSLSAPTAANKRRRRPLLLADGTPFCCFGAPVEPQPACPAASPRSTCTTPGRRRLQNSPPSGGDCDAAGRSTGRRNAQRLVARDRRARVAAIASSSLSAVRCAAVRRPRSPAVSCRSPLDEELPCCRRRDFACTRPRAADWLTLQTDKLRGGQPILFGPRSLPCRADPVEPPPAFDSEGRALIRADAFRSEAAPCASPPASKGSPIPWTQSAG